MRLLLASILLMLPANAGLARSSTKSPSALDCPVVQGWNKVAQERPQFVVFGELHGTEQSPRFLSGLACSLAARGQHVLVAIEHGARNNPALQAAWQLPSGKFEPALARLQWAGQNDGRYSKAMFDLIVQLHVLKERGLPVSITAFNGPKDEAQARKFADLPGQGPHEARQAENIADAANAAKPDITLVLVGNLHAARTPIEGRGPAYDPMARRLTAYGKVVSLDMSYGSGSAWNCILRPEFKPVPGKPIPPDQIRCAAYPAKGNADFKGAPFIRLMSAESRKGQNDYDGLFWVGATSASPPKFR